MQVSFTRSRAFKHPLATHSVLDVLGYRRNGAPIYAIAGGNGEGEGGSGSGSGQGGSGESADTGQGADDSGSKAGDQGGQQSGKESGQSGSGTDNGDDWKAHAREWEKRAKENKAEADKGKAAIQELEELRKANLSDQEKAVEEAEARGRTASAEESAKVIETKDSEIRDLRAQLAVYGRAEKHSVQVAPLLNSRSFYDALGKLDPAATGFTDKLDGLIKAELKANPGIAVQTAGKSGGDLSAGTGEGDTKKRPTSLSAAVRGTFNT
ncbi:DUF4200 domain-containing protein [Streptomyces pacificus]|uniref:Scaffolding protein n=1 Tax=Streptomyces pacificus TaxID=2705029 RepID=A0A6A0AUS4_9ACTN|nr:DUF4200 domain-containing protein [Streptomyces pacificus]GFH36626.1 hypothetical protein SCWH03_28570 [Streptomyces pacificus]